MFQKQNTHDTEKGLLAGIIIGSAITYLATSKKVRDYLHSTPDIADEIPKEHKRAIKELQSGAKKKSDELQHKAKEVKDEVADKI